MCIMDFTVEETNLVAIYIEDMLAVTLARIAATLPYMDEDMRVIAENVSRKLALFTEQEFVALSFTLDDETEGI